MYESSHRVKRRLTNVRANELLPVLLGPFTKHTTAVTLLVS
jgi:hypothetical protein